MADYQAEFGEITEDGDQPVRITGPGGYDELYFLRYDMVRQWVAQELEILNARWEAEEREILKNLALRTDV